MTTDPQQQIHQLQQELLDLNRKQQSYERLSAAIFSMYNEFRDETISDKSVYEGQQFVNESPIIVLDKLRSSLRFLLHNKQNYEANMRAGLQQKFDSNQTHQKTVSDKLDSKIQENKELKNQIANLQAELDKQNLERKYLENDLKSIKDEYGAKNAQLLQEVGKMQTLSEQLNKACQERDTLIKNRDTRLGRLSELETKLSQKDIDQLTTIHTAQTANIKLIKQLTAQRDALEKIIQEGGDKDAYIQQLQHQITDLRKNLNVKRTTSLENENYQLNQRLVAIEEQNSKYLQQLTQSKLDLQRISLQNEQNLQQLHKLQSENTELLNIGTKEQSNAKKRTFEDQIKTMNKSQKKKITDLYSAQTYEEKLRDKDKEIEELANRVRRLLALQHKANLSQKAFQEEKQQLEAQIAQQRDEIAMLRKITINTNKNGVNLPSVETTKKHSANEELLRDLQNMKAFGMSAAAAGNQNKMTQQNSYSANRSGNTRQTSPQRLFELDDVPEKLRPNTTRNRKVTKEGTNVGYGVGSMLGGIRMDVKFGIQ